MATAYVYNGFGCYENVNGELGITLTYGGVPFFLPFEKVTVIPDWTFREIDHDKTTPEGGEEGILTYKTFRVNGHRVAEELLKTQVPVPYAEKGIIQIRGKETGKFIEVYAGRDEDARPITVEVREVEPTKPEREQAAKLALDYKKRLIQEYFQSKRERMAGGKGRLFPEGLLKVFMAELNVEDIDDVSKHQKGGTDVELLKVVIEEMRKANEINGAKLLEAIQTVRKTGKQQLTGGKPRSQGLAEYKKIYDEAVEAGATPEEATEAAELATKE